METMSLEVAELEHDLKPDEIVLERYRKVILAMPLWALVQMELTQW